MGLVSDGGRALGLDPHRGADRARRPGGGAGPRGPRVHRRPRHAADLGARPTSRSSSAGCATPGGSAPSAAATTRWTATAAGSGRSSPTTRSSTPRATGRATAAEAVAAAHERGETDEFIRPTVIGDYDGVADGDVAIHFNFRPDRARQLVMALARSGLRRVRSRRRARHRADDADLLPGGVGLPGRLPAARAGDDDRRGARPRPGSASCTSPRPRSTPTSPTSSTAAARRSGRGRSDAWSTRRATSPPTTSGPR